MEVSWSQIFCFVLGLAVAWASFYLHKVRGFLLIWHDLDERETQQRQKLRQQAHWVEQFENMSHDLLTPLQVLYGGLYAIKVEKTVTEPEQVEVLLRAVQQVHRLLLGVCRFYENPRDETISREDRRRVFTDKKVLLVEDDLHNQKIVRFLLNQLGVNVDVVGGGELALQKVRTQKYDLVFMDVSMPGMDGLEATRRIRRDPQVAGNLSIIAFTANASHECRLSCLMAGMNDYISKPVDIHTLETLLHRWFMDRSLRLEKIGDRHDFLKDCLRRVEDLEMAIQQCQYQKERNLISELAAFDWSLYDDFKFSVAIDEIAQMMVDHKTEELGPAVKKLKEQMGFLKQLEEPGERALKHAS